MKKLLTLALALLLGAGLSVPAMAFTSDTEEDDSVPYDLKIYLVEYDDNDFFGIASLPKSDRGYAKNEIVAAVVELFVPDDEIILNSEYGSLVFGGDNIDLDVADNYDDHNLISLMTNESVEDLTAADYHLATALNADDEIEIAISSIGDTTHGLKGEETYQWLFFAKVTGDNASLYAKLKDGNIPDMDLSQGGMTIMLDGIAYAIMRIDNFDDNDNILYVIIVSGGDSDYPGAQIFIYVDEDHVSQGMTILPGGKPGGILGVNTDGELGVAAMAQPAVLKTSGDLYDDVMDVYNDVVVDVFKLDYFKIGNYVRDSYFEDLVSPKTLIATVDIAPWTAYVSVPDNIVVDPPKTGDAASIMGFVMVALSAAGVVALRKRG